MKRKLSLGNSLLLAAPLVASLNLGILPSSAAILAGDGIAPANTQEIIDRIDALELNAASGDKSDREASTTENLLSIIGRDLDKQTPISEEKKSFWGNLSGEIHEIFASDSETEFTAAVPVNAPANNVGLPMASIQAIDSLPAGQDRDPFRVLLKSLNISGDSDRAKNQPSVPTYTGRVEPAEINPSPVAEDNTIAPPSENKLAKVQTYTAAASSQVVKATTTPKLAQLSSGLQGDRESFDYMQLVGGALGLGFFIWMLFQD